MALTRDEIIAAIAARKKDVVQIDVPEWGGKLALRRLTAADVERTGLSDGKRDATMFAKVIAASVTDEEGEALFAEEDVAILADADMATAARVFAECMRVNGLMDADLEEAVAGFTNAQPDASSSD
jgi:hypothetical protein